MTPARTGRTLKPTKDRIIEAALRAIKEEGYAGTTARAIAQRGGFNQAAIYYHFGDVKQLLLAALDETSRRRMDDYKRLLDGADSPEDLIRIAATIFRQDLKAGHITVLSELIAGSLTHKELGPAVVNQLKPWIAFAEEAIRKVAPGSLLESLIPVEDVAVAIVAFYVGIDLLHQLDRKAARAEALFESASRLAPMISMVMNMTGGAAGDDAA